MNEVLNSKFLGKCPDTVDRVFCLLTCTRLLAYRTQMSFTMCYIHYTLKSVDISGVPKRGTIVQPTAKQKNMPHSHNPPIPSKARANPDPELRPSKPGKAHV